MFYCILSSVTISPGCSVYFSDWCRFTLNDKIWDSKTIVNYFGQLCRLSSYASMTSIM